MEQLEMAGQALDRLAEPLTVEEVTIGPRRKGNAPPAGRHAVEVAPHHELARRDESGRRRPSTVLGAAATVVVVIGGLVALSHRGQDSEDRGATAGESVENTTLPSAEAPTTADPLAAVDDLPPDTFPADVVRRFAASLGDGGTIWVYDSASTAQVCFVRQLDGTISAGCIDQETYAAGQGWARESNVLWGITAPTAPVTVTSGTVTVASDFQGLWFMALPADAATFTISTAGGSTTYEIASVAVATTAPPSASMVAGQASAEFCNEAVAAAEGRVDFRDPEQIDALVNDPSISETDRVQLSAELQHAAAEVASGQWSNEELVHLINRLCGIELPAITMAP